MQQVSSAVQDAEVQLQDRVSLAEGQVLDMVVEGMVRVEVVLATMQNGERATVLRLIKQAHPEPQPTTEEGKGGVYQPQDSGGVHFSVAKVDDLTRTPRVIIDPTRSPSTFQVRAISGADRTKVQE